MNLIKEEEKEEIKEVKKNYSFFIPNNNIIKNMKKKNIKNNLILSSCNNNSYIDYCNKCLIWDDCCKLYINVVNGDMKSFHELENISKNGDVICLFYYALGMESLKIDNKQIINQISEIASQILNGNVMYTTNKHQLYVYGCFYNRGIGKKKNLNKSLRLLHLSADQKFPLANYQLGEYYRKYYRKEKVLQFEYYLRSAEQNFSPAQFRIGLYYSLGIGIEENLIKSFDWTLKSATQGYIEAWKEIASMYWIGRCVEKNISMALEWYQRGVDRGDLFFQYCIAHIYKESEDISKIKEGYELIKTSAERGYSRAQLYLGLQYFTGEYVKMDENEAVKWIQNSNDLVSSMIGQFYFYGNILEKDRNKAIQLLLLKDKYFFGENTSYLLGIHYLQHQQSIFHLKGFQYMSKRFPLSRHKQHYYLGLCYENGLGVYQNLYEAYQRYYLSSHSDPLGQYNLGRCYEEGIGVEVNLGEARRLYELAANQGEVDAINKLIEYEEDKVEMAIHTIKQTMK